MTRLASSPWRAAAAMLALLASASAPMAAGAQEAPTTPKAADEPGLVAEGVALRQKGHDSAAFDVFSHAWERFRTPRAQAHLGLAAQALGRWALAETHLQGALESEDPWVGGKRKLLEDALVVVRRRLGSLEVLANVSEAEVLVDGQVVGQLPLGTPLRLPAGTVVLQVQAGGHVTVQRTVTVEGGQLSRETFHLVRSSPGAGPGADSGSSPPLAGGAPPVEAPATSSLFTTSDRPSLLTSDIWRRRILYGAIGLTALGVGLTTWSGLDTLSARDRYVARPTEQLYNEGIGRQRRTNALMLTTGLVAAGTVAWALLSEWGAP
jgi:hypothetical protein